MKNNNVEVLTKTQVTSVKKQEDNTFYIKTTSGDALYAHHIAIASGGYAAPETGSTGDGFKFLKKLGHTVEKSNPNIVPLTTNERWVHKLAGVNLSFMKIRFIQNGAIKIKKTGKILFTHFGISSPLILNTAHEVKKLLDSGNVTASIDLFPDTEENELDRRVWRLFEQNKNKMLKNVLPELLPESLSNEILHFPDIQLANNVVHSITKDERKKLVKKLKDLSFPISGTLGFDKAVIADGGVLLEEINFKNMTSKLHPNIYLLGDILNINRPTGGYSLQLCWTTGWVAGTDMGKKVSK